MIIKNLFRKLLLAWDSHAKEQINILREKLKTGQISMRLIGLRQFLGCKAAAHFPNENPLPGQCEIHDFIVALELWDYRLALYALALLVHGAKSTSDYSGYDPTIVFQAIRESILSDEGLPQIEWPSSPRIDMRILINYWLAGAPHSQPRYLPRDHPEVFYANQRFFEKWIHMDPSQWLYNHTYFVGGEWLHLFQRGRKRFTVPVSDDWKPETNKFLARPFGRYTFLDYYFPIWNKAGDLIIAGLRRELLQFIDETDYSCPN